MKSGRSRRGAGLAVVLAAGTALACSDAPTGVTPGGRLAPLVLSERAAGAFQMAFEDARARVLPGLTTAASRDALAPLLDSLASAVRARDRQALRTAVARAEATLAAVEGEADATELSGSDAPQSAADGPELGVLRLLLDHVRVLAATDAGLPSR